MVAGVALGPSFLQPLAPDVMAFALPPEALPALGQVGLVVTGLYMLGAGLELDARQLRARVPLAARIAPITVAAPFAGGLLLSTLLPPHFRGAAGSGAPFAIFLGGALTITGFPVLVRLLRDRALLQTPTGVTAVTCATVNDISIWTVLAVTFGLSAGPAAQVAFVALAIGVGLAGRTGLTTRLVRRLTAPVELLLPVVFAVSGLRTDLPTLATPGAWVTCAGIILLATTGTVGGAVLAARLDGQAWREAWRLGALLNTRGLMGLVLFNAGLDRGLISPPLFAMLVVMGLVTTAATGPFLDLTGRALQSAGADSIR